MPISVFCNCGNALQVSADLAGRKIRCKACNEVLRIPAVPLAPPAEPESGADEYEVVTDTGPARTCPACGVAAAAEDTACLACGEPLSGGGPLGGVPRPVLLGAVALVALLVLGGLGRWAWLATRPGAWVGEGVRKLNEGSDLRGAEQAFKRALDYAPRHPDAIVGLARVGIAARDGSLVRRYAPDAIELLGDPQERAAVELAFAWSLLDERAADRARELAEQARADDPRLESESWAVTGLAALLEEERDAAFEALERADQGTFEDARVSRALAELYHDRGRAVDARTAVEEALKLERSDPELWLLAATLRGETGDRAAERDALGEAIRLAPTEPRAHLRLAEAHLADGDLDRALEAARRAAELAPQDQAARVAVGRVLLAREEHAQARDELTEAVKLGPSWEAEYLLGRALVLTGDVQGGLRRVQAALAQERERAQPWLEAARLALDNGESQTAAKIAERAVELWPDDYDARLIFADALARTPLGRRRHDEQLRAQLEVAIKLDPKRREAPLALGLQLFEQLRPEDAMAAFSRGLEHNPRDAELLYYKGWAAIRARAWDEAIEALEACKRVDPGFRDVEDQLLQAREGKFYEQE